MQFTRAVHREEKSSNWCSKYQRNEKPSPYKKKRYMRCTKRREKSPSRNRAARRRRILTPASQAFRSPTLYCGAHARTVRSPDAGRQKKANVPTSTEHTGEPEPASHRRREAAHTSNWAAALRCALVCCSGPRAGLLRAARGHEAPDGLHLQGCTNVECMHV